jgi:hypothetical protein
MQANNGVLVIDDFGRQTMTPQELLNRWIVPLDRSVDYLSLDYGMKFEIPFDCKIVFSTNLQPETLGDEAFFRRIQSKILIPTIDDDQFDEVLRRVSTAMGVEVRPEAFEHLRWVSRNQGDGDLRPYLPAAVLKILVSICAFADLPLVLDEAMVDRVANIYFTHANRTKAQIKKAKKAKKNRQKARQARFADGAEPDRAEPDRIDELVREAPDEAPLLLDPPTPIMSLAGPSWAVAADVDSGVDRDGRPARDADLDLEVEPLAFGRVPVAV